MSLLLSFVYIDVTTTPNYSKGISVLYLWVGDAYCSLDSNIWAGCSSVYMSKLQIGGCLYFAVPPWGARRIEHRERGGAVEALVALPRDWTSGGLLPGI